MPASSPLPLNLAILLGLATSLWLAGRKTQNRRLVMDAALVALISVFLGGRLVQVLLHSDDYSANPAAVLPLEGGLTWGGAFWGGVLGVFAFGLWRGVSFWEISDLLTPGLAVGQAAVWMGCHLQGCGYGIANNGSLAYLLPDIYGLYTYRLATPALFTALFLVILVALLIWPSTRSFPGFSFTFYLLMSSLGQFFLDFLRGEESVYLGLLRGSQILAAAGIVLALILFYIKRSVRRKSHAYV